jgi:hypothetical protein
VVEASFDPHVGGLKQINDSHGPVIEEYAGNIRPFSLAGSGQGFSLDLEVNGGKL